MWTIVHSQGHPPVLYSLHMTEETARKCTNALLQRFAEERCKQGLSKRKLAEAAGLDPKAITLLERGDRMPAITNVLRIASALSLTLSEELAHVEPKEERQDA